VAILSIKFPEFINRLEYFYDTLSGSPIRVIVLSEAQVCGISITGIAVSNSAAGMDLRLLCPCVSCVCSDLGDQKITLSGESYRVCVCVCVCLIMCDPET